jgi:hypothetical protein
MWARAWSKTFRFFGTADATARLFSFWGAFKIPLFDSSGLDSVRVLAADLDCHNYSRYGCHRLAMHGIMALERFGGRCLMHLCIADCIHASVIILAAYWRRF